MTALDVSAKDVAFKWLDAFASFLLAADYAGVASCFLDDGWLRDILIFSWNNRSLCSPPKIESYVRQNLKPGTLYKFKLDDHPHLAPTFGPISPTAFGVASGFTFESPIAYGQGYFNLLQDETGQWRALTVLMSMKDIIGHEEIGAESGVYGGHTLAWIDVNNNRRQKIEANPHVLIVGGGQSGLNVAARFRQMNIPALIVEQNCRIGDNWRKRYPTLSLHTPKNHHAMLYQSYPEIWPVFTPRDKVGNWLEQYSQSQDLVIWNNSRPLPTPSYDPDSKRWTVVIDRDGEQVTINPAHIVLATGTLGAPRIPSLLDNNIFQGTKMHACEFAGGHNFTGRKVVVVGAGNTSADICQDLAFHGAEVTMVQRSTTCVVAASTAKEKLDRVWPDGVPTWICDLKFVATPLPLIRKIGASQAEQLADKEKPMQDGLRKAGMDINMGPAGTGNLLLVFERLGGYWLDVGCADLIISGKVKVKQGVEPERLTKDSVVFTDGSSLAADTIIFATGYENIRDTMKELFGNEIIDMTGPVWGLDEEGEIRGSYRPSGHPGLWFATGDFFNSRFSSKQLALEIKAIQLGLMEI